MKRRLLQYGPVAVPVRLPNIVNYKHGRDAPNSRRVGLSVVDGRHPRTYTADFEPRRISRQAKARQPESSGRRGWHQGTEMAGVGDIVMVPVTPQPRKGKGELVQPEDEVMLTITGDPAAAAWEIVPLSTPPVQVPSRVLAPTLVTWKVAVFAPAALVEKLPIVTGQLKLRNSTLLH